MYITYESYVTASGKYPERLKSKELTDDVKDNITRLLDAVNSFIVELQLLSSIDVSSGFRPSEVNAATKGAAKKSYHTLGLAVDISDDKKQSIANLCKMHPHLLKKHGLWLENPANTIGKNTNWCHLDLGNRSDRPSRIFNP